MSCNEWKEYTIEELCSVIDSLHKSPKYVEYGYPIIRVKDMSEGFLKFENPAFVTKEVYEEFSKKHKPKKGDMLFSRVGSYGITTFVDKDVEFCLGQNTVVMTDYKYNIINNRFMYYMMISDIVKEQIEMLVTGSTQKTISMKSIKSIKIPTPSIEEQEKIANILSSLDDKIQLNNEMNKILEEMAQSIFKRWFVDFEFPNEDGEPYKSSGGEMVDSELGMIPKGWEVKTIGDLCEVGSSKRIFMKEYVDSGVPFYRGKEIIEKSKGNSVSTELFITKERFEEIKEKFGVPNKNDILLTSVGTLGVAYLVDDEDFYFKDGNLTWFKNFKEEVYRYFIYQWIISSEGKKSIDAITIGSTQKALTINALKGMKLVLPSDDMLSLFEGFIKSNISNIRSNNEEKNNLIDIRDSLLPKLMNGEIDIKL